MKNLTLSLIFILATLSLTAQQLDKLDHKLLSAKFMISNMYVTDIDEDNLTEGAIRGMLKQLDPFSTYLTPKEVVELKNNINGTYYGLGIEYKIFSDTLLVMSIIPNSPADIAKIEVGDKIYKINNSPIPQNINNLKQLPDFDINKKFKITYKRYNVKDSISVTVKKANIDYSSIDASFIIKGIGYIRVNRFSKNTSKEIEKRIKSFVKSGCDKLILDLRDNGGGLLSEAIATSNLFLSTKQTIVSTKGKNVESSSFVAIGNGLYQKERVAILVNNNTASASEIVSAALQEWDRAAIIGTATYGKGLVQRPIDLADKSRINLTIAYYYTPTGRCIQKPFIEQEVASNSSIEPKEYKTMVLNRSIYGDGGITPDYIVESNLIVQNKAALSLLNSYEYNKLITHYIRTNQNKLITTYDNFQLFLEKYKLDEGLLINIVELSKSQQLTLNTEDIEQFKIYIKAQIAEWLWKSKEFFYKTLFYHDKQIKAAIEILNN